MAFLLKNRVKTTTTTTGTGTLTISTTAATGFQNATVVGDGNSAAWTVAGGSEFEVFVGTVGSSGTALTRDTVLASSNGGAPVSFSAGTKDVFCALPAELVGWNQIASIATTSGSSVSFTSIPAYYSDLLMVFEGVSGSAPGNATIELSDNNGTNWTAPFLLVGIVATDTLYGPIIIPGYRLPAGLVQHSTRNIAADRSTGAGSVSFPWRIAAGINAIRIAVSAGTLDAGTITLFGRL